MEKNRRGKVDATSEDEETSMEEAAETKAGDTALGNFFRSNVASTHVEESWDDAVDEDVAVDEDIR